MVTDETVSFSVEKEKNARTKEILKQVYEALTEKGYNPINQIIGYLLSGDSSYITGYKNARSIIKKFERDEILEEVIQYYLNRK